MTPYKRAVAVTGSYTDRQGNEKKRYTPVGTLFKYDDGNFTLKIDAIPAGNEWKGFVSFFDIEERGNAPKGGQTPAAEPYPDSDEIPF